MPISLAIALAISSPAMSAVQAISARIDVEGFVPFSCHARQVADQQVAQWQCNGPAVASVQSVPASASSGSLAKEEQIESVTIAPAI